MDLETLRQANRARQLEWPGNDQADTAFRAIEVAGEAGEALTEVANLLATAVLALQVSTRTGDVLEKVKKHLRATRGIKGSVATTEDIALEMGDLIIALDLLADNLRINLSDAAKAAFNKTSAKYELDTVLT